MILKSLLLQVDNMSSPLQKNDTQPSILTPTQAKNSPQRYSTQVIAWVLRSKELEPL